MTVRMPSGFLPFAGLHAMGARMVGVRHTCSFHNARKRTPIATRLHNNAIPRSPASRVQNGIKSRAERIKPEMHPVRYAPGCQNDDAEVLCRQ